MKPFISQLDKANHFIAGTVIYCLSLFILSPLVALIPVIVVGAAKEVYDEKKRKGRGDIWDFLYTIAGAIPVLITHL
jgi:hypothetical protein